MIFFFFRVAGVLMMVSESVPMVVSELLEWHCFIVIVTPVFVLGVIGMPLFVSGLLGYANVCVSQ